MQMLRKAIRFYRQHGPGFVFRRALLRFDYHRFERRRTVRDFRSKPNVSTVRFLDQEFELHPSGKGVSEEMAFFGTHEPVATAVYLEHLQEGDHVLDVGANLGYYLLLAAQAVGPSGKILGFEPARDVYSILERNVARSGLPHIKVFPWAIGGSNGSTDFYESEIPNLGSVIQDHRCSQTRTTVPIKRLDDLLNEFPGFHPNVLRMDVEGGELTVLEGAQQTLQKYRPTLFIEFHTNLLGWKPVREAILKLHGLGYSSSVLVERMWDHPLASRWVRARRWLFNSTDNLFRAIESRSNAMTDSVFTVILKAT